MKIRSVEAELFHVDGRTDGQTVITKLIVALPNFANVSKDDFLIMYDENKISFFNDMRLLVYIIVLSLCSRY